MEQHNVKTEWPELVNELGSEAKGVIEQSRPDIKIFIIPDGSFVTADYREDRVRLFINEQGRVASTPTVG